MMLPRAIRDVTLAICSAILFGAPSAAARGDLGVDRDACALEIGPYLMYFAGYQPGVSPGKFCEDVPSVGRAIFVFDYAEPRLREMTAEFRILRQSADSERPEDIEAATLGHLPRSVHPNGTFSFEYIFTRPGDYVGLVTVDGAQGEHWVARFPFSVAPTRFDRLPFYLIAAAVVLGLFLLLSRERRPPKRTTDDHGRLR